MTGMACFCDICGQLIPYTSGNKVCPNCRNTLKNNGLVKVIRCAECKHYMADANKCTSWTIYTEPNGFCHRAERVDDEKTG